MSKFSLKKYMITLIYRIKPIKCLTRLVHLRYKIKLIKWINENIYLKHMNKEGELSRYVNIMHHSFKYIRYIASEIKIKISLFFFFHKRKIYIGLLVVLVIRVLIIGLCILYSWLTLQFPGVDLETINSLAIEGLKINLGLLDLVLEKINFLLSSGHLLLPGELVKTLIHLFDSFISNKMTVGVIENLETKSSLPLPTDKTILFANRAENTLNEAGPSNPGQGNTSEQQSQGGSVASNLSPAAAADTNWSALSDNAMSILNQLDNKIKSCGDISGKVLRNIHSTISFRNNGLTTMEASLRDENVLAYRNPNQNKINLQFGEDVSVEDKKRYNEWFRGSREHIRKTDLHVNKLQSTFSDRTDLLTGDQVGIFSPANRSIIIQLIGDARTAVADRERLLYSLEFDTRRRTGSISLLLNR